MFRAVDRKGRWPRLASIPVAGAPEPVAAAPSPSLSAARPQLLSSPSVAVYISVCIVVRVVGATLLMRTRPTPLTKK